MEQRTAFEIAKEYINYLQSNEYDIQRAYIFGSYASQKFHADSDIDLALILNHVPNSFTMQVQLMKLSRKFDTRLEPHPFDEKDFNASNPFANEILVNGIQIV